MKIENIYAQNFYLATIVRHIDGDTTVMTCDLGQHVTITHPEGYRWLGIDAMPLRSAEGDHALRALNELLPPGSQCLVRTVKTARGSEEREKYGRFLVEVWSLDGVTCYNDLLVQRGLVRAYTGRGPRPSSTEKIHGA